MPKPIEGLRSPYEKTGGIHYFGRMLDKIRLHSEGKLPPDYIPNLGKGFDNQCLRFLRIEYQDLVEQTLKGGSDEELFEWAKSHGYSPNEDEILVWNEFMRKLGWNDDATPALQKQLIKSGFLNRTDIQTIFDYIDLDEGL